MSLEFLPLIFYYNYFISPEIFLIMFNDSVIIPEIVGEYTLTQNFLKSLYVYVTFFGVFTAALLNYTGVYQIYTKIQYFCLLNDCCHY